MTLCCQTYPLQRTWRTLPALSPRRVLLGRFPLASPLPSAPSAAGCPTLFGDFIGTTGLCDSLNSFTVGVRPWTSRRVPPLQRPRASPGPPGSRARCFRTCTGSATARDPGASRDIDAPGGALRLSPQRRRPEALLHFRGSIPGPHVLLSTLRCCPYEQLVYIRLSFLSSRPRSAPLRAGSAAF